MRREQKRSTFSRGKSPPNMSTVWDGMSLVSFCFATVHTGQRKVQRGRRLICCCSRLHSFLLFFVIEILFVVAESERAIDGARHPRSAHLLTQYVNPNCPDSPTPVMRMLRTKNSGRGTTGFTFLFRTARQLSAPRLR